MNDELTSLLTKIVITAGASWFGSTGFDVNQVQGAVSAAVTLGAFAYGVYQHRGMKKVPVTATVIPAK